MTVPFPPDLPAMRVPAAEASTPKLGKLTWPLLGAALAGSTILDAETTLHGLKHGTLQETNPLMRPLVKGGRLPTYGALMAANAGLMLLAHEAQKRKKGAWWAPIVLPTLAHTAAGVLNARLNRRR